ncbi:MAG: carboxypeptidase regulatory-like domain-containing protein [Bryobacteraceae bacterium]
MKLSKLAVIAAVLFNAATGGQAQSTFGSLLGTVKEPSGGVVPNAKVSIANKGTAARKATLTDQAGNYQFVNLDVRTYEVAVEAAGFQKLQFSSFDLSARETKRIDANLTIATQTQTVNVEAAVAAVIQTDSSNIAESKGSLELTNLPVAITTRSAGSTSAFSTLTAQPGVQTDDSGNIAVAGAMPSQLSITIDGISSVGPGSMGALAELFPSFNAIEEIRISETLNPAEYGGVADITTVSKSGTNLFHGGAFENLQNTALNASDTFSHETPTIKLNDFGIYGGGPVVIPHLYNGRNKTFFFGSFERLRLPKQFNVVESVPTAAMRNGDLSAYSDALTGYDGNIIPVSQINSYSQKVLNAFYPLPNYGDRNAVANNYLASFNVPTNSAQGDVRIDQVINPSQLIYARYTYKNRRVLDYARDNAGDPGSEILGSTSKPEIYSAATVAHNWVITPRMVNEIRAGFTKIHRDVRFGVTSQQAADELGLTQLPGPLPPGYNIPTISIAGFMGTHSPSSYLTAKEGTSQFLDTLTYSRDKHTLKFGGDVRKLSSLHTQVFSDYRMGSYQFNGSALGDLLGSGAAAPLASFLLGYPDQTTIATVINPDTYAYSMHYAVFAQDDWKVTSRFTLNFGLRWEFHPSFHDHNYNLANFDPNYVSTVDGQTVHGAVIIPADKTLPILNPGFVQAIAPTPVLTAAQAGVPTNLRFSNWKDFAPRIGFAWRLFGDNKTVLRGGYGRFIEALLASGAIDGWAVESSNLGTFTNSLDANGRPVYSLPYSFPSNISQPGTQFFDLASNLHYKDPYVQQWNLTLERNLGKDVGLRASYDGNHGSNLGTTVNIDQLRPNTQGYNALAGTVPFPLMADILSQESLGFSNYNAGTVAVQKRGGNLQFQVSYSFTRNLANTNGAATASANGYAGQIGNSLSDPYNPSLDYGNVPYTRRHRVLSTFLYQLPFGKGRTFLSSANGLMDRIVGGWELSGVVLFQSGPFMTVTTYNDPSGTGYNLFNANGGRADRAAGVSPSAGRSIDAWVNQAAYADPDNDIGRFGNAGQGDVNGPGTQAVSLSLLKKFAIAEGIHVQVGAQVANALNHPNYAPPGILTMGVPAFGQITSLQSAEGAGPRSMQLAARITF